MKNIFLILSLVTFLWLAPSGQLGASIQITGLDLIVPGGIDDGVDYYFDGNSLFIDATWNGRAPATFEITFNVLPDDGNLATLDANGNFMTFAAANVSTLFSVDPFRDLQGAVSAVGVGASFAGVTWETTRSAGPAAITNGAFSAVFGDLAAGENVNVTGAILISEPRGNGLAGVTNAERVVDFNLSPTAIPEPSTIAIWSLLGLVGFGYSVLRGSRRGPFASPE